MLMGGARVSAPAQAPRPDARPVPRDRHGVHRRLDLHPDHRLREPLEAGHGPGGRDRRRARQHRQRLRRDGHRRVRRSRRRSRPRSRTRPRATIAAAIRPITETLVAATPLIFTGLAVAISFRSGVFNIGVEGQFILGAFGATVAAITLKDQPTPADPHRRRSLRGVLTGAVWGFIPGFLKAKTGAHEVITTIMLNYVAVQIVLFGLRSDFLRKEGSSAADLQGARLRAHPRPVRHLRPAGDPPALGLHRRPGDGGGRLVVPVPDDEGLRAPGRRAST